MSESTRYAVLGLVARQPIHGYALVEQIRRWPLERGLVPTASSVYKALRRLARERMIEPLEAAPESRAERSGRTTYGATATGRERFEAWLRRPATTYEDLCLRIGAARRQDLPLLIAVLDDAERACAERLRRPPLPEVEAMAVYGASWPAISAVLLGTVEAADAAGRARLLRDLRVTLEALHLLGSLPAR
ncbi:MAG: PadR family transcriptional regulator [Conexibacter sp.]|nr:PadR family transcriptional regulator [Conexibacter sp.]